MQFSYTFEEEALKEAAARFVADNHSFEVWRDVSRHDNGFSRQHWSAVAELGWLGLPASEELGGFGGTLLDATILMEEMGRGLMTLPYISSALLPLSLLGACAPTETRDALAAEIISGERLVTAALAATDADEHVVARRTGSGLILNGKVRFCPDAAASDGYLLPTVDEDGAQVGIAYVSSEAAGLNRQIWRTIDERFSVDLTLEDVEVDDEALFASTTDLPGAIDLALDQARLMLAAEALGIFSAAIERTIDYLKDRQQFGEPLARRQVLSHRVAELYVAQEHARSIFYRALSLMEATPVERAAGVSAMMVMIGECCELIGGQAVQLHGGIGMADEHIIGNYYKRLRVIARTFGDTRWHLNRFSVLSGYPELESVR